VSVAVTSPGKRPRTAGEVGGLAAALALAAMLAGYAVLLWTQKWIGDDGYIYLAYVRNLFDHGELTYNLGERVDAATGFLWLLALVAGRAVLFFLDLRQATFVLSWCCCLAAFALIARRVLAGERRFLLAIALLFVTPFVVSFSTSGLETPLILLLTVAIYFCARAELTSATLALLVAAAPFVRPELGIIVLIHAALLLRRRAYRPLAIAGAALLAIATVRWLCFGDILPNTAFVKLFLPTYEQGRRYVEEFLASYWHLNLALAAFAALVGWGIVLVIRRRRLDAIRDHHILAAVSTLFLLVYVDGSGGDFMHGRFFLTPVVFVVLLVVDATPWLEIAPTSRARAVAIPLAAAALAALASQTQPSVVRDGKSYYRIDDEQRATRTYDPRLEAWSGPNPHKLAALGARIERLARKVGRPVGIHIGAIGLVGYTRDAALVYIYDDLSLAQVAGSMLATQGFFRRAGHNAIIPEPLKVLEPRLTLIRSPDPGLVKILTFVHEEETLTLGSLSDLDAYVAAGILPRDTWARVDARIEEILADDWVDRNVIFFLRHRYPADRPLADRIRAAYASYAADEERSWIRWYEQQRPVLDAAAAIQRGERRALPARYALYLGEGTLKPIETTYQQSSWATPRREVCKLDLSTAPVKANRGVALTRRTVGAATEIDVANGNRRRAGAGIDLRAAVATACGGTDRFAEVVLDWVVRDATGGAPSVLMTKPGGVKHGLYRPGPPLRIPLDDGAQPVEVILSLSAGTGYVLALEAKAVAR
jgi:hypothetical protein